MAVFSKLNQFREMRREAKKMKNVLGDEIVTGEALGGQVKITMNGNFEVQQVNIDDGALENKSRLEEGVADAYKNGMKKIQKIMAAKVRSGELEMPNMGS